MASKGNGSWPQGSPFNTIVTACPQPKHPTLEKYSHLQRARPKVAGRCAQPIFFLQRQTPEGKFKADKDGKNGSMIVSCFIFRFCRVTFNWDLVIGMPPSWSEYFHWDADKMWAFASDHPWWWWFGQWEACYACWEMICFRRSMEGMKPIKPL